MLKSLNQEVEDVMNELETELLITEMFEMVGTKAEAEKVTSSKFVRCLVREAKESVSFPKSWTTDVGYLVNMYLSLF